MKLRNKKTGEIVVFGEGIVDLQKIGCKNVYEMIEAGWEDYEEPKGFWMINILGIVEYVHDLVEVEVEMMKEIGNYFETAEEAEKAVEKLKTWKRLKDKGFRFDVAPALGHCDDERFDISIIATMPAKWWYNDKVVDDIHYVFGGEE